MIIERLMESVKC